MKATGFGECEHVGVPEGCIQYWEGSSVQLGPGCKTPLCEPQQHSFRLFRIMTRSPLGNHHDHLEFPEPSR